MIKFYAYVHIQGLGPLPIDHEFEREFLNLDDADNMSIADLIELVKALEEDENEDEDDDAD